MSWQTTSCHSAPSSSSSSRRHIASDAFAGRAFYDPVQRKRRRRWESFSVIALFHLFSLVIMVTMPMAAEFEALLVNARRRPNTRRRAIDRTDATEDQHISSHSLLLEGNSSTPTSEPASVKASTGSMFHDEPPQTPSQRLNHRRVQISRTSEEFRLDFDRSRSRGKHRRRHSRSKRKQRRRKDGLVVRQRPSNEEVSHHQDKRQRSWHEQQQQQQVENHRRSDLEEELPLSHSGEEGNASLSSSSTASSECLELHPDTAEKCCNERRRRLQFSSSSTFQFSSGNSSAVVSSPYLRFPSSSFPDYDSPNRLDRPMDSFLDVRLSFCEQIPVAVVGAVDAPSSSSPLDADCAEVLLLGPLLDADRRAAEMFKAFDGVMSRLDCHDPYSVTWNCDDCRMAYKNWLCAMAIPVYHRNNEGEWGTLAPCQVYSENVESKCPYLSPHSQIQYAGESTFLSTSVDSRFLSAEDVCHYPCDVENTLPDWTSGNFDRVRITDRICRHHGTRRGNTAMAIGKSGRQDVTKATDDGLLPRATGAATVDFLLPPVECDSNCRRVAAEVASERTARSSASRPSSFPACTRLLLLLRRVIVSGDRRFSTSHWNFNFRTDGLILPTLLLSVALTRVQRVLLSRR